MLELEKISVQPRIGGSILNPDPNYHSVKRHETGKALKKAIGPPESAVQALKDVNTGVYSPN